VPDLLGFGQSDKPHQPADYGMPNLVSDVIAVLDAAGVERAHVWGYEMFRAHNDDLDALLACASVVGDFPVATGMNEPAHEPLLYGRTAVVACVSSAGSPLGLVTAMTCLTSVMSTVLTE
jgi:hypothetical protein